MKKAFALLLLVTLLILNSCGGSSSDYSEPDCSFWANETPYVGVCTVDEEKQIVLDFMRDKYLWPDAIRSRDIDIDDFETAGDLIKDLRDARDVWSNIITSEVKDDVLNGRDYLGYGFKARENEEGLLTYEVASRSPAGRAGIVAGDTIVKIDEIAIKDLSPNPQSHLSSGDSTALTVKKVSGAIVDYVLDRAEFTLDAIVHSEVIDLNGANVGYLVYNNFNLLDAEDNYLEHLFKLKTSGVSELILDLRGNGGGVIAVAADVAGIIRGGNGNELLVTSVYNACNADLDKDVMISATPAEIAFNLERVIILTSSNTASSSELLINGLKPHMEVVTVGSTTYGKPVGMNVISFCEKVLVPVTFYNENVNHERVPFSGIEPDCVVEDNFTALWGDPADSLLSEALYYLGHEQCSDTL